MGAKAEFSDALWRLLENKDFDDITAADIAKASGYGRPSFYRYFKDKYELMSYSFERFLSSGLLGRLCESTAEEIAEGLLLVASSNRRKILHALSSLDERALRRQAIEKLAFYAQRRLEDVSTPKSGINARSASLLFANSVMGIFIEWLSGSVQLSHVEMRELLTQWVKRLVNIDPSTCDCVMPKIDSPITDIEHVTLRMLEDKTIDALRVETIVEQAGIKRPTFYRQYEDKYDVVNRYFEKQANDHFVVQVNDKRLVVLTEESVTAYLSHLLENRTIVLNAANTSDPNGLKHFATGYFKRLIIDMAIQVGTQNTRQLESVVQMFCIGAIGHVNFWLKEPRQSVDEVYGTIRLLFPSEIVLRPAE